MHEKPNILRNRLLVLSKRYSTTTLVLGVIVVLLVCVRAVLPSAIQWKVNREIDESTDYVGSIGDVDLQLVAGAYQVEDITISKTTGDVPVPLFSAGEVRFSLLWRALLHGSIVTEVNFRKADIHLVDSSREQGDQTGEDGNWISLLNSLVPFRIDRLTVEDSELHFHNFEVEEQVDVSFSHINASARNISNSSKLTSDMTATIQASGELPGNGEVEFSASFSPDRLYPVFNMDGRVTDMSITGLDSLIKAYAPFDVEGGNLTLTTELAGSEGDITGYVKPLITGLEVFEWKEDVLEDNDNPLQVLWEAIVGLSSELLENQPRGQLATIVPISGRLDQPDTDNFSAFLNILRNAFVEAFNAGFENTVSVNENELPSTEKTQEAAKDQADVADGRQ